MMKITVPTPQTRYNPAQTIVYWMPFAQFGETPELFVAGGEDPWYCSTTMAHGLMHWNTPAKLSAKAKPMKLVELINFQINDDIDIGNEDQGTEESEPEVTKEVEKILAKTSALKVGLPTMGNSSSSSMGNPSSSDSSSSSSSSSSSLSVQPARVSPLAKNATTTVARVSPLAKNATTSKQAPKKNKETKKRQREESDSDSDDDHDTRFRIRRGGRCCPEVE